MTAPSVWALTTGEAGNISQAHGLAAALGRPWVARVGHIPAPWRWLPSPWGARAGLKRVLGPGSDSLAPPWPAMIIACGRRAATLSLAVRAAAGPDRPVLIQLLDPQVSPRHFDLVIAPEHDGLRGPNVLTTLGALHRLTPARLAEGARVWAERFAALPSPRVAVLIGGASGAYRFGPEDADRLASQLAALAAEGVGLMVTLSRRTGAANAARLRAALAPLGAYVWDGSGPNPYDGMLALADAVMVTEESVSMLSEACFTGKPVLALPLPGGSARFARFHHALIERGHVRRFTGTLELWTPPAPLDEPSRLAEELNRRFPGGGNAGLPPPPAPILPPGNALR
ncbi:mitochondrial fission ELM1 family protein [Pararhodospirillum photometricum]|uniref:mitochondrial fission ELM1 family protein n=1 Tax=Pararhodospirillum photometricum TaxID=1084 RepID=UPI0002E2D190|nr:mitochondrial fission ELM1 family protein [Pararhodospirillum photometricum]